MDVPSSRPLFYESPWRKNISIASSPFSSVASWRLKGFYGGSNALNALLDYGLRFPCYHSKSVGIRASFVHIRDSVGERRCKNVAVNGALRQKTFKCWCCWLVDDERHCAHYTAREADLVWWQYRGKGTGFSLFWIASQCIEEADRWMPIRNTDCRVLSTSLGCPDLTALALHAHCIEAEDMRRCHPQIVLNI